MKITTSELRELICDDEYRNIPSMLAYNNCLGKPWWQNLDELKREAAKATIWEGCQTIAMLFDTYGDAIKSVSVKVNVEQDKSDTYMTTSVYVNDEHCFDGGIDLEEEALDRCDEIDGQETLNWAVGELDMMGNSNLMSELDTIETAFEQTFTSAEQAREVAKGAAPEINKWFTSKLLTKQVQDKIEVAPSKKGGPKL